MTYPLADAARYLGVPVDVLRAMNWAEHGPKAVARSYWSPVFEKDSLDAWLATQDTKAYVPGTGKAGVWAVKRMRAR